MLLVPLGGAIFCEYPVNSYSIFILVILLSFVLGVLGVIPIGGADMPVVIALLNSYSGLVAAAAGFIIQNTVLIVAGCLVGANGVICWRRHNRSSLCQATAWPSRKPNMFCASWLTYLKPMARRSAMPIYPVAGRMPGHMNVLLAEADVPYEQLIEMDAINPNMSTMDVAIVIGANDVVNPAAREVQSSPIYGMPIINVDEARTVFVLKRSMASGFAGIENPLFFNPNTRMLCGDAKASLQALVSEFKST